MSEREEGWYWVRHRQFSGWHIAEKTPGGGWLMTGIALPYDDDDMKEIGARIPTPGEPWQCVPVDWLKNLRSSIAGDCYMGEEWEIATIEAMLAAAPKPGGE